MAHPYHHALSSVKKWGGAVEDYLPIHDWFDATKAHHADFRHRALRHHAEGIFLMESIFGPALTLSTCKVCGHDVAAHEDPLGLRSEDAPRLDQIHLFEAKVVPTRWVGEQHVLEDLGRIPAATEWLAAIQPEAWMNRSRRLSRELDQEVSVAAVQ